MQMPTKENSIKILWGSVGTIIALIGALFALDSRYAHAAEVIKDKAQVQRLVVETALTIRQQMLEDKLFEYDFKREQSADRRLSPLEAAQAARYKRQLDEIIQKKAISEKQ
jgi:hypothetical protein